MNRYSVDDFARDFLGAAAKRDEQGAGAQWLFLPDPSWTAENEDDRPPLELVVGMWIISADGVTGPFQGNPDYRPPHPGAPTDPADAAIRLATTQETPDVATVLRTLRGVLLGVALDEDGHAMVASLPDDVAAVLVTTAPVHRANVDVPGWRDVLLWELTEALPEGVDLLVNPGASASMHVQRATVLDSLAAEGREPADATTASSRGFSSGPGRPEPHPSPEGSTT